MFIKPSHFSFVTVSTLFLSMLSSSALAAFSDVFPSHPNASAIAYVQSRGIVRGYADGTFRADRTITRAEFTKMVVVSYFSQLVGTCRESGFRDVIRYEWYERFLCVARERRLVDGYLDGHFRPSQSISFTEAAKIIVQAKGIGVTPSDPWYRSSVERLAERNAIPTSIRSFNESITRGELAEILYRLEANIRTKPSKTYQTLSRGGVTTPSGGDDSLKDLSINVRVSEDRPEQGDSVTFTVQIENRTSRSQRIDLEAVHDRDLKFSSASDGGEDETSVRVRWRDIRVDAGEEELVTLRLRVDSEVDEGDQLDVRFTVEDDSGNEDVETLTIEVDDGNGSSSNNDDLDVRISVDEDKPEPGDVVTFKIRVENNTNDDQKIDVNATFDDDFTFVSADGGADLINGDEIEWRNVDIDEDDEEVLKLRLRVRSDANDGDRLDLDVEVEDEDNNRDSDSESVDVEDDDNDDNDSDNDEVSVSVSADVDDPEPGDVIVYDIRLINTGSVDTTYDLRAHLDPDLVFLSGTDNVRSVSTTRVDFDKFFLQRNIMKIVMLRLAVRPDADDGDELDLDVTAEDALGNTDTDTETVAVQDDDNDDDHDSNADLRMSVSVDEERPSRGDVVRFEILIQNDGNDSQDIALEATFDDGFSFVSATRGGDDESDRRVHWDNIEVDEDDEETVILELRIRTSADRGDELNVKFTAEGEDDDDTETETIEVD